MGAAVAGIVALMVAGWSWWTACVFVGSLSAILLYPLVLQRSVEPDHGEPSLFLRAGWFAGIFVPLIVVFSAERLRRDQAYWIATLSEREVLLGALGLAALVVCLFAAVLLAVQARAAARRAALLQALQESRLQQERDAAAREAAEARLRLLQAQIQPHFIFNTLAALQRWVDTGDARASALLASLTGFLRGSTDLLSRDAVRAAEEAERAQHYLAIMQARLGERLTWDVAIEADAAGQELPAGLLLTLVENAVEHGVAPALRGGEVQVRVRRDGATFVLCVRNTGAALPAQWRCGVGLANSRERLAHRFGQRASLSLASVDGATEARVTITDRDV